MEMNFNTGLPFLRVEGTFSGRQHCCSHSKHIWLADLIKTNPKSLSETTMEISEPD